MTQFNIKNNQSLEDNYQQGLLPQRNQSGLFYCQTSSRSNLKDFSLSSENRRILKKTTHYSFQKIPLKDFTLSPQIQKQITSWVKQLGWDFPTSSIKTIFGNHIFNQLYIWKNTKNITIAYAICYYSATISHIAYVFYHPSVDHSNLPIRLVLEVIVDSQKSGLKFCYLGRFSKNNGYYKRNMPGFEHFIDNSWQPFKN